MVKRKKPRREIAEEEEPEFTTSGRMTSPKFGAAGSGGAEYEPGPSRRNK